MGKVNIKINLYKITQTLQYLKRKKNIYKCNQNTNTKKIRFEHWTIWISTRSAVNYKKKELNNYLRGTPQNRLQLRKGK